MQKFKDIEYRRPDFASLGKAIAALAEKVEKADSADALYADIRELEEITGEPETMATVAYIRNTVDSNDKFYEDEVRYVNSEEPKLIPVTLAFKKAVLASPFRAEVEARIGKQYFRDLENDVRLQDERLVEDLVRESDLREDYSKLIAGCKTTYRGVECNFYGLLKFMEDPDREVRRGAFLEWARLYEEAAPELDRIYSELVALRVGMAKKMGYESYVDYRYLERGRFDYTKEDVAAFRDQVRDVIVPVCEKLVEEQRKAIGVDKIKFYDEAFLFPDGNAEPRGSVDELVAAAQKMYRALSPETGEFFDFMVKYELYDLLSAPGKRQGGYCTAFPSLRAPFIFSNFNGTTADAEVLTHEAGHAFEMYTASRTQELMEYVGSVSEINEIHSMSME
ncbi:MAG: M3 family oligoendopeptidase, partial [Clostridia bacterium]|nr:M3 family oligoendopeptidase [Clostridia bacterium]